MDNQSLRSKFITVLDALRVEHQRLHVLHDQTLKGDFPESYSHYSEVGLDFDETQQAILDDILDKITENCTKTNTTLNWIDKYDPPTILYKKPNQNLNVTFDYQTKTTDGERRAKKPRQRTHQSKSARACRAYLSRQESLSMTGANMLCATVVPP